MSKKTTVATTVGIILSALLVPWILLNFTIMVKNGVLHENPPSILGVSAFVVTDNSLRDEGLDVEAGDMAFSTKLPADAIRQNEVVAYHSPEDSGVTHLGRIMSIQRLSDNTTIYNIQGDMTEGPTIISIGPEDIVGRYMTRWKNGGNVALFMHSDLGAIVCIVLPLAGFLLYDFLRRRKWKEAGMEEPEPVKRKEERPEKVRKKQPTKAPAKPSGKSPKKAKDDSIETIMDQYGKYLKEESFEPMKGINPKPRYYVVPKETTAKKTTAKKVKVTLKRK